MDGSEDKQWWVYLLRCKDDTLYCGVSNDLTRRLAQHNGELVGGAKYTQARRPCELVYQQACTNRSQACIREAEIKKLSRTQKKILLSSSQL